MGVLRSLRLDLVDGGGKLVSQAGRSTLIKSVPEASTQHSMQSFLWSKVLTNKADKLVGDLFWGFKEGGGKHMYIRAWDQLCCPKAISGLGFHKSLIKRILQSWVGKLFHHITVFGFN